MALQRTSISDFSLANNAYIGATVTFYTVDSAGVKTTTKATLYADRTSATTLANPQTLDSNGKFAAPVYHDVAVIASVTGVASIADHDTGIILPVSGDAYLFAQAQRLAPAAFVPGQGLRQVLRPSIFG